MKMPSLSGVITVWGDQEAARKIDARPIPGYSMVNEVTLTKKPEEDEEPEPESETERVREPKVGAADATEKVPLSAACLDRKVVIGTELSDKEATDLVHFFNENKDIFAWSARDLKGVSRDLAQHSLNVEKTARPKKQRLRKLSEERSAAAAAEIQRLSDAGVIRPVQYPEWLANVVMVQKKSIDPEVKRCRMCVDFTDLNKSCPKDPYPLPRIDTLIDIASGSERMSLLDCFSGYHQIHMNPTDEEKTSFITLGGTYCFKRMPEGL